MAERMDGKNVIVFNTLPGHNYLIVRKEKEEMLKQNVYESRQNNSSKSFYEAALGKSRNF